MDITLYYTKCSKGATLSVTIHGTKHYHNIVGTLQLNTHSISQDRHEVMMEACYNGIWGGIVLMCTYNILYE